MTYEFATFRRDLRFGVECLADRDAAFILPLSSNVGTYLQFVDLLYNYG